MAYEQETAWQNSSKDKLLPINNIENWKVSIMSEQLHTQKKVPKPFVKFTYQFKSSEPDKLILHQYLT